MYKNVIHIIELLTWNTHSHTHTHTRTHAHTHTRARAYVHTRTHTDTQTHKYVHAHATHTHTHTCTHTGYEIGSSKEEEKKAADQVQIKKLEEEMSSEIGFESLFGG